MKGKKLFAVMGAALAMLTGALPTFALTVTAAAAETGELLKAYEERNIMDDLQGSVINGKIFELSDYPADPSGAAQVLSFIEFGYSRQEKLFDEFGLYVYVYNPQELAFDDTVRNKIQFTYGSEEFSEKYELDILNSSEDHRFYKFKVFLTARKRSAILSALDENARVYSVSSIELVSGGSVKSNDCGQTYTYTGFAEGYGTSLDDALQCSVDITTYLSLDVHPTYFRPKGTNGTEYTQDTLHSVYFSVPNETIGEYGEMTAVHATWLNAQINPVLVTGNTNIYNAIYPYIGIEIDGGHFQYASDDHSPIRYALIAGDYNESAEWNNASHLHGHVTYNANSFYTSSDRAITSLPYIFLAGGDADDYIVSSDAIVGNRADGIKGYLERYTEQFGGELVNDRYSKALFESVDNDFTDITLRPDDTFKLTDEMISQNWWQKYVGGGYNVQGKTEYVISAIKKVEEKDFLETPTLTSNALYIDESDYDDFKTYYDAEKKKEKTVYLFRYFQSDYSAYESIEYARGEGDWTLLGTQFGYEYIDTNAYFFQMWVQLDFDILDLEFTKDGVSTVIPVVMDPIDIAADATPPLVTTSDKGIDIVAVIFAVAGILVIAFLVYKIAGWIFGGKRS